MIKTKHTLIFTIELLMIITFLGFSSFLRNRKGLFMNLVLVVGFLTKRKTCLKSCL